MKRQFYHKGTPVPAELPLTLDGLAYPWNWFDLASPSDLAAHGFTYEDVPATPEQIAEDQRKTSILQDTTRLDMLNKLRTANSEQIDAWVNTNVTDIASARNVIKMILKVIALDMRT